MTAVLTDDSTFKIVQYVYSKYFSNSQFKLVRCNTKLVDLVDIDQEDKLIQEYHRKSNHRGINESFEHLKREYYFPNIKTAITRIINNCEICQKYKYDRNRELLKFEISETPSKPLEILHIDIYSVHKENFLTIIDKFSKFAGVYLLTSRSSINLIQSLKHFFSHHGVPKTIVTDNGTEFVSSIFREFLELYDITLHTTYAKVPPATRP